jgi:arylformamidase
MAVMRPFRKRLAIARRCALAATYRLVGFKEANMATEWIDISVPIYAGMVRWPGDPPVEISQAMHLDRGDICTVSRLALGLHTGTHVDAPSHFLRGARGVDSLSLEAMVGPARVIEIVETPAIGEADLAGCGIERGDRILLKTSNSARCWSTDEFVPDSAHLTLAGAAYLAGVGIRTVGIDYLSIGHGDDGPAVHRALLGAEILIVEGLNLSAVEPGAYDLVCLPLKIRGGDGAPARALLKRRGDSAREGSARASQSPGRTDDTR